MKHKAGVTNRVADALIQRNSLLITIRVVVLGFVLFRDLLDTDPYFSPIMTALQMSEQIDFLLHDGFLFKGNQLCVPDCSLHL